MHMYYLYVFKIAIQLCIVQWSWFTSWRIRGERSKDVDNLVIPLGSSPATLNEKNDKQHLKEFSN